MGYFDGFLDDIIFRALRKRKKVTLFLCKDIEGGFGIRIDGTEVERNLAWESFEIEVAKEKYDKILKKLGLQDVKLGNDGVEKQ
jgi:hypothetical protein